MTTIKGLIKKPLIYKLLMIVFLVEPLIKLWHLKLVTGHSLSVLIQSLNSQGSPLELFLYWLAFPLAGLTLTKIRKGSYFVFIFLQLLLIYDFFSFKAYSWPYYTKEPIFLIYFTFLLNIAFVLLFLHPSVRTPFFNRAIRWWESKTRYFADIPCEISYGTNQKVKSVIMNVSQTGAFVQEPTELVGMSKDLSELKLKFEFDNSDFELLGRIASRHKWSEIQGWGVQFRPTLSESIRILKLILSLKRAGYKPVR